MGPSGVVVVCGASGRIGGTVARMLRLRGVPVKALVRDPLRTRAGIDPLLQLGCTLATADLHDEAAVLTAFRGADQVLAICPLLGTAADVASDAQQVIEVLGAALDAARPRRVVAISDYGSHVAAGTGITLIFRRLEERLRQIPIEMTFVRSAEHMQNWLRQLPAARDKGLLHSLHHPLMRPFPTVSAFDVGVVAAEILLAKMPPALTPQVVHVEGPRRYSAIDFAEVFALRLAHPVVACAVARDQWQAALAAAKLVESYARLVSELQDAHNAGLIDVEDGGYVRRGTTTLADALGKSIPLEPVIPLPAIDSQT